MTNDPISFPPSPPAPGPVPLGYADPYARESKPPKSAWRRVMWIVFVVLFGVLFLMLSRNTSKTFTTIPYSEFNGRLKPAGNPTVNVLERSGSQPDRIEWLRLSHDTLFGKFIRAEDIPEKGPVTYFKVNLPEGMGSHYPFFRDIIDRTGVAKVDVEPGSDSLVVNILLPLIPWLLIFAFVWFFATRLIRKARAGTQLVLSGPGRWIPDPPAQASPK